MVFPMWIQAATCSQLYGLERNDDGLVILNEQTGEFFSKIPITLAGLNISGGIGLSVNPINHEVYVALKFDDGTRRLASLDMATGVATEIGQFNIAGTAELISTIAFDDAGVLWAVSGSGATVIDTLFTVNTDTAELITMATLGNGNDGESIAFNPIDGLMYHRSGNGDANVDAIFESIDLNTFAVVNIPLVSGASLGGGASFGLIFDSETGLILETNIASELLSINPSTGEILLIGTHDDGEGNFDIRSPIFYPLKSETVFCDGFETAPPPPVR